MQALRMLTHTCMHIQKDVSISVMTANIPDGLNYSCVFNFRTDSIEHEVISVAERNGDLLTCVIPLSSETYHEGRRSHNMHTTLS